MKIKLSDWLLANKIKIKLNDWLLAQSLGFIFSFENELKFYNLKAWWINRQLELEDEIK